MALIKMKREERWRAETEALIVVGAGPWVVVDSEVEFPIAAKLKVGGGTGKIQTTDGTLDEMKAGTADADDWDKDVISATDNGVIGGPVTGVRAYLSTAGSVILKLTG